MEDFSIERAGVANLDFTGELIGQSAGPTPHIKIYRTKGGKYIGQTNAHQKMAQAQHFDTAPIMINWFRSTTGISAEIEDAIEEAAKHEDGFKAWLNEHVD